MQKSASFWKTLALPLLVFAACALPTSAQAETYEPIGYHYQWSIGNPNPYSVQELGPYQGLSNPPQEQACSQLGYTRQWDQFEVPDPGTFVPGSCYEHYDFHGTEYTFDGAGQDKTYYYTKPVPNLTAGSVTPTSATVGTPVSFNSSATNIGTAPSGSFPILFQINTGAVFNSAYLSGLSAGATGYGSASYTFNSAGTYQVRACANMNTSYAHITPEGEYGDNCGPWQSVTVNAAQPTPTQCNLSVVAGQALSITLTRGNLAGQSANVDSNFTARWGDGGVNFYAASPLPGTTVYTSHTWNTPGTYVMTAEGGVWSSSNSGGPYPVYVNGLGPSGPLTCIVSVSAPAQADLIAGSVSPSSATVGQSVSFNTSASNSGNATSGSFPILFQIDTGAVFNTSYLSGLAPGATGYGSASYTFSSAGTYQIRACANMNTSYANITSESNYTNNCGPWTSVTVAAPPPAAIVASCSVSPATLTVGGTATWTASASGGTGSYTYSWTGTDGLSGSGSSVTKSYNSVGMKYGSVTVTSGTQSSTVSCNNSLSVGPAAQADLTAGIVTPTTATVGTPVSFNSSASNIGIATSGSFPILFQLDTGTVFNSSYLSGLAPNTTGYGAASHTFSSAGTYQIRACANMNTSYVNITTESNYGNNCGPWATVTVSPAYVPPSPAPTCSLSAGGSTVPTTLTWSSTNASTCAGGGFNTGGATTGTVSVSTAGNYTLSCTGTGGSCSASTAVSNGTCAGPADMTIAAAPNRVRKGQTSTITWTASNVPGTSPACTVSGPGVSQTIPAGAAPSCVIPNGSATPTINTQSTYTINCSGATRSVTVNVIPEFQEF